MVWTYNLFTYFSVEGHSFCCKHHCVCICVSLLKLVFIFLWDRVTGVELLRQKVYVVLIFIDILRLLSQKAKNSHINISSFMKIHSSFPILPAVGLGT